MAILIAAVVLVVGLERIPRWRWRPAPFFRPGFATDLTYLLTGHLGTAGLALAWVAAGEALLARLGVPPLPLAGLPRWLVVALAVVALDAGNYAAHWLLHRVDVLWKLHEIHHSSPALDGLATFRSHLAEQALRRLVAPLPLIAAGVPLDVVAVAGSVFIAWAVFNHSNLRPNLRTLEPLLVTPRLHRLHHLPRTAERNLGTVLTVWDRLRGTLVSAEPPAPGAFGLPGDASPYPEGWWRQLGEPFRRRQGRLAPAAPRRLGGR